MPTASAMTLIEELVTMGPAESEEEAAIVGVGIYYVGLVVVCRAIGAVSLSGADDERSATRASMTTSDAV